MPGRLPGQAPNRLARPRPVAAGAALLAAATALALTVGRAAEPAHGQEQTRPNIVVLFTDDQETASMRVMKTVNKEMKRKGVTMKNFYAQFPLCCPSRATMLTGQYAHNHRVLSNTGPDGGYGVFNELHGDNNLAVWMQNAGYTTSYIGKFMNEYAEPDEYGTLPRDVPKGWDDWRVLAPSNAQYFGYTLNQNGRLTEFGEREQDYSTDVFTTKAKRFIRRSSQASKPFFLTLGYAAPHGGGGGEPGRSCNRGAVPAPRDLGTLKKKRKSPLPASFNEADVSEKPSPVSELGALTPGQVSDTLRKRRCAWESLLSVDDSVGEIVEEIKRDGVRSNTYVFFLSDNGYLRGEHRIRNQKRYLYEESARTPFIARGPGIARNSSSKDVVTNADLAPTILGLAGVAPGVLPDGESIFASLAEPELEQGRAILLEAYAGDEIIGLRNSRYLYTEWDTGRARPEIELYDNYSDPEQLDNLAQDPGYAGVVDELGDQLEELIDCAGAECRGRPSAELNLLSAGNGKRGCAFAPIIASLLSPEEAQISSVDFRIDGVAAGVDADPPFGVVLPEEVLREALPNRAEVVARADLEDGRRVARPAKIKICR
jgi:N-acetylglucosamine-6-sulfatase